DLLTTVRVAVGARSEHLAHRRHVEDRERAVFVPFLAVRRDGLEAETHPKIMPVRRDRSGPPRGLSLMAVSDSLTFREWAQRWMDLAAFEGPRVPDSRIRSVTDLWRQPIPGTWKRERDARLLDPAIRYCRTHTGGARIPRGEHR